MNSCLHFSLILFEKKYEHDVKHRHEHVRNAASIVLDINVFVY